MAIFKQPRIGLLAALSLVVALVLVPGSALAEETTGADPVVLDFEPTGNEENPISDNVTRLSVGKFEEGTDEYLKGAKLAIYEVEDGEVQQQAIAEWESGEGQEVIEGKLSVDQVYVLRELTAPSGYGKVADTYFVLRSEDFNTKGYITNKNGVKLAKKDIPDYVRIEDVSGSGNSQAFIINLFDGEGNGTGGGDSASGDASTSRAAALAQRLAKTGDETSVTLIVSLATAGAVMLAVGLHRVRTHA